MTASIESAATAPATRPGAVLSAVLAQAAAFSAPAVLSVLLVDMSAEFAIGAESRLWPLAACALPLVAAATAARRLALLGPARYVGSAGLAALVLATFAAALAPGFAFLLVASFAMGAAAGVVIPAAARVLEAGPLAGIAGSALAVAVAVAAGVLALAALPGFGWRGILGLAVVLAVMATWAFGAYVPSGRGDRT